MSYDLWYNKIMKNIISFNSKFGWISAVEEKGKIIEIKFSKRKNLGKSSILKRLRRNISQFFYKKTNNLKIPFKLEGSLLQKKYGMN